MEKPPPLEEEEDDYLKPADFTRFLPQAEDESKNFRSIDLSEFEEDEGTLEKRNVNGENDFLKPSSALSTWAPTAEDESKNFRFLDMSEIDEDVEVQRPGKGKEKVPKSKSKKPPSSSKRQETSDVSSSPACELSLMLEPLVECGCCECCPYHYQVCMATTSLRSVKKRAKRVPKQSKRRRQRLAVKVGRVTKKSSKPKRPRVRPSQIMHRLFTEMLPGMDSERAEYIASGFAEALFQADASTLYSESK